MAALGHQKPTKAVAASQAAKGVNFVEFRIETLMRQ
jgi:hypothetical protein